MSEFLSQLKILTSSLMNLFTLFFNVLFNQLKIFGIGIGWYCVFFGLVSFIIYTSLGVLSNGENDN